MWKWCLGLVMVLAACATPYEQCKSGATKDLRVVTRLIAEKRAVIDRGYAIRTETLTRTRFRRCEDDDGTIELCRVREPYTRKRPVAVDLEQERNILAQLITQRDRLEGEARRALAACRAAYPEG